MSKNLKNKRSKIIKSGDMVMIISGDHKGEKGKVTKVFPDLGKAIVEGLNIVKRHVKPSAQVPGGIVEKESPIHLSNLMLLDENEVASKISFQTIEGNKVRVSKKTKAIIK